MDLYKGKDRLPIFNTTEECQKWCNAQPRETEYAEEYSIVIDNVPSFRKELVKMIEQVKYQIGEYSVGSSSQIAERFEHKVNANVK